MKTILLQPAFVLHKRSYRESSLLVELWTRDHGRLSAVAKGVRKQKGTGALWQLFTPILISLRGNGELLTVTSIEPQGNAYFLQKEALFAGFYLNELMMYTLQKSDPHQQLFYYYETALQKLAMCPFEEQSLRQFEKYLLEELGYGLLPKNEYELQRQFQEEHQYRFNPGEGFRLLQGGEDEQSIDVFAGKSILAIAREEWSQDALKDAKRLMRLVMATVIGTKPFNSRRLFVKRDEGNK